MTTYRLPPTVPWSLRNVGSLRSNSRNLEQVIEVLEDVAANVFPELSQSRVQVVEGIGPSRPCQSQRDVLSLSFSETDGQGWIMSVRDNAQRYAMHTEGRSLDTVLKEIRVDGICNSVSLVSYESFPSKIYDAAEHATPAPCEICLSVALSSSSEDLAVTSAYYFGDSRWAHGLHFLRQGSGIKGAIIIQRV